MMSLLEQLNQRIAQSGGLIVSCQPVPNSPLDKPDIVAAMALAAEQAGAVALRIEGIANLSATRAVVSIPIIGILKRDLDDSPVRITPFPDDVAALAQAGFVVAEQGEVSRAHYALYRNAEGREVQINTPKRQGAAVGFVFYRQAAE